MSARFSVLASGSSGNSSLLWTDRFGLLIDFGLGSRMIASRFRTIGVQWNTIHAAILTHTHGDHWRRDTLGLLLRNRVPLYCHIRHLDGMASAMTEIQNLRNAGLLHFYEPQRPIELPNGFRCTPIEVAHDSFPTFAFRIDDSDWSVGYAADLGTWTDELVEAFREVNLLAIEFNHDEDMERNSNRPDHLIERVLGDRGHLSNRQAAELLQTLLERVEQIPIGHVVQLHLSRHCNVPALAVDAARQVLQAVGSDARIHTATQDIVLPPIVVDEPAKRPTKLPVTRVRTKLRQPLLPGFEDE